MDNSPSAPEPERLPEPTPQPSLSKPYADPEHELRASDADRERVAEALRDAYAEGRLDADEHAQRLDSAYAAKTMGDLVPLTKDLPDSARPAARPAAPALPPLAAPEEPTKLLAVFGGAQRKGRYRAGRLMRARAVFGGIEIDLRDAEFDGKELVIDCVAVFGGIAVLVPDHVTLRGGGAGIFGGFDVEESPGTDPTGPVVTIRGAAVFGGIAAGRKDRAVDLGKRRKQLG